MNVEWTTDKPTLSGYYWTRLAHKGWVSPADANDYIGVHWITVREYQGHVVIEVEDADTTIPGDEIDLWAGPLIQPEVPPESAPPREGASEQP